MMKKLTLFLLAIMTFLGLSVQVNAEVDTVLAIMTVS